MSSSSSLSGGKYTRDLKLRVLEHYFRNGGDVFGNKQSTAKKFGIVTKTINRFLQIPELVRLARKNAKSSKSAAGGSSDGFKEPLLPGASGSGGRPRPQRQSVRITLPSRTDESIVGQSADPNSSSIIKLLKIFELGTQEIRDLLAAECDLIYECRACRALFRSVADLLAHKRRYCTRPAADSRQLFGSGPGQSLSAASDGVLVLPLAPAVERLPEVRQAAAAEARAAAAQPVPPVRLDPLPGSAAAVLQTVGEPERSVAERLAELRQMEAAADRTVRLGRDGRVVESDEEEEEEGEGEEQADTAETEDGRHVCQHCNTTFSTRKTLSHHVRSLHSATRVYYPCSLCSAAFINMFSVERHLQKVHKKKQEEIDVLKEGIKKKSFQRNVSEIIQAVTSPASAATSATPASSTPSTNAPVKITSFEWKCRQCSRRYLSLPVGLQHVQSVHPQFSSARAGLVRVCRIVRQVADSGAVSTRSSSGAVTPADREPRPTRGAARDADTEMDGETSGGDSDGRMLFNKANLLKRLASGGERCVLCRKVFTGHLQACGHLRLHDQPQIEAYLGKKVRFIRKRRPADAQAEPEEYELDAASGVSPTDGDEQESEADAESVAESDAVDETAEDHPAAVAAAAPASVESRGFPVQMVAAERVRRRHFVHALPGGEHVCTLCEARFPRWPAARAHLARHSRAEVASYVKAHAVNGLVGVPASLALRPGIDAETAEPVIESEPASDEEMEEPAGEDAEGAEEEEEDEDDEDIDMSTRGETGSVDTDIEAGAKLLVSCKLWSPGKRRRPTTGKLPREEPEDDAEEEEEEDEDYDDDDGTGQESIPLTQELDGEIVDKWMVMRTKGLRLRCIMCNKTFMRNGYAEIHLGADHTFEEVRDFLRKWGVKGVRVPPRTGEADADEDEESDAEEPEDAGPPKLEPQVPHVRTKANANVQPVAVQKGTKRPAEAPALAAAVPKVAKREPTVLNVPAVKTPGTVTSGAVGPIGPNTRILKISRSDLLQKCEDGARVCLVCDRRFDSHPDACEHMRQHSDADIRNFIKTRGREFLPAFEERQKQRVRRLSEGAAATGPPTLTPPAAIAPAVTARSLSVGAVDAPTPPLNAASVAVKSSKPATPSVSQPTKKPVAAAESAPAPEPPSFHRDEAVNEFEMFDKGQLLKRQDDGTKCLLCTRVFAKHSSACGHLSHHGEAEVQAWRGRMRKKASALLQLARRPRAYGDAEDEKDATAAGEGKAEKKKDGTAAMDVTESGEVKEEAGDTERKGEQPEVKKAKTDNSPAKSTKASSAPARTTRRKDSVPVKVTRIAAAASDKEAKTGGAAPVQAPSTNAATSGKVVTAAVSEPKTVQVIHGSKGTGKLLVATEKMANKRTKSDTDGPSKPDQKNTTEPPAKAASPANQKAFPANQKAAEASVKSPGDKLASDKTADKTPAKTGAPSATPVKASQPAVLSSAAGTVMVSVAGTGAVSVVSAAGGTPLRTGQLLKLPQGMLKVALLQAADGTLQTAGGRHVMQLAPGVKLPIRVQGMKLPITAANLPRVLRPIAPKEVAGAASAAGVASAAAGAGVLLQPPTPGTLTISGPVSPPRPRPPPLLRAPLMQMASGRAAGGSITVHIPASLKTTATPATPTTPSSAAATATATAPQPSGALPAGKDGVQTNVKSDSDKRDAKTDVKAEKDTVDAGQSNAKADGKKSDKPEVQEKRPTKDAQSKVTTVVVQVPGEAGVKSDKEAISEADAKPAKRQGEVKGSAAKVPASAAASRPATVTKRAFIPEAPGKAATRCSWTPEPGNKSSPRAPASASSEPASKTSPPALPPGEVPQTRARAEAAVAARMRQTRRASASAAADKK